MHYSLNFGCLSLWKPHAAIACPTEPLGFSVRVGVFCMVQTRVAVITSSPELGFWLAKWWNNPLPDVELVQVICNRGHMRSDQFPVRMLRREDFPSQEAFEFALLEEWMGHRVDYIIAWEFDLLFSSRILDVFSHKVLNLHPSLLPQFAGFPEKVYRDILQSKPSQSGATLHEIVAGMDAGKIIAQQSFSLALDESLFSLKEKTRKAGMELILDYFLKK
jgi:phosphoribosylglycinamide formyltransferase-1